MAEDESLYDDHFLRLSGRRQANLIATYCADIEERIRRAGTKREAERLVDETCARLEQECASTLLSRSLVVRVREMMEARWGTRIKRRIDGLCCEGGKSNS